MQRYVRNELKAFREKQKERRHEKVFKGNFHKGHSSKTISTYSTRMAPIGSTIGDAFGDVLDEAVKHQEETTVVSEQPKKKSGKKKISAVTDGQINGKQMEVPKAEKSEAEEIIEDLPEEIHEEVDVTTLPEEPVVEEVADEVVVEEKPKRKYTRKKKVAAEDAE